MPFDVFVLSLIASTPAFSLFVYYARESKPMWVGFALGGAGWFAALFLRTLPLRVPPSIYGIDFASTISYLAYASLLAGLFEEGTRYFIWPGLGVGEALIVYVAGIVLLSVLGNRVTFFDGLAGAIESEK